MTGKHASSMCLEEEVRETSQILAGYPQKWPFLQETSHLVGRLLHFYYTFLRRGAAGRKRQLFPGMMLEDGGLPGGGVDVGVDLGGEDGLVAEHFLDDTEVGAVLDEVRREGVAEGVGGDFLVDARDERLLFDEVEDGHPAQRVAVFVEEGDVVEGRFGGGGAGVEVLREGVCRHFAEGHEALFVALADHAHEALLEIDVRDL